MAGFLKELTQYYQTQLARHRNLPFLKAVMAACALVATAQGNVSLSQRLRVDQILETLDALKFYDPHEGVELFNAYSRAILADPAAGRKAALDQVQRVGLEDPEKARLLIRICLAVSEANGEISLVEQIEIVSLCGTLGLDSTEFGLYRDPAMQDVLEDPGSE